MTEPARSHGGAEKPQVAALLNRKTSTFELRGEDGKMYAGDFTFKRLTIAEIGKVAAELARLNGGHPVDKTAEFIKPMRAPFRSGIVGAPGWWNVDELYDLGVMKGVFDLLWDHEQSFRA